MSNIRCQIILEQKRVEARNEQGTLVAEMYNYHDGPRVILHPDPYATQPIPLDISVMDLDILLDNWNEMLSMVP